MSNINFESCALDTNGGLKPASAITWFNNVDNNVPMATVSPPVTASSSSSSLAQGTLNNFVHLTSSGKVPAALVAGAC